MARNRVAKELDGHVVVERFECLAPERWSGISMSVLDRRLGRLAADVGRFDGELLGSRRGSSHAR